MSACEDREAMLHAYYDGELDSINAVACEAHLRGCAGCAAAFDNLTRLRAGLVRALPRKRAPDALRRRIMVDIERAGVRPVPLERRALPWLGGGVVGALAASLALVVAVPQLATPSLPDELVAGHIRSLEGNHLVDVVTSDRHTVKPWFNGRLDYAPPVVDLSRQGFPLVGGRLDYVAGRPVAALVYRRRLHTINLFVRPADDGRRSFAMRRSSYNLVHWQARGLSFWAVSDVAEDDLRAFRTAFAAAALN